MRGLLADHNADGHLATVLAVCQGPGWRPFWDALGIRAFRFGDLAIKDDLPDDQLLDLCQREGLILVTNNRNRAGEDSLEAAIRRSASATALPVLTFADPDRIRTDRQYVERVAIRLIEILQDIDTLRGAGRLFLP